MIFWIFTPLENKNNEKTNVPYRNSEWRKVMYIRNMMRNIKNIDVLVLQIMNGTEPLEINVLTWEKSFKIAKTFNKQVF